MVRAVQNSTEYNVTCSRRRRNVVCERIHIVQICVQEIFRNSARDRDIPKGFAGFSEPLEKHCGSVSLINSAIFNQLNQHFRD